MTTNILPLLPIMIPFFAGIIMLFMGKRPVWHRVVSGISGLLMMLSAVWLVISIYRNGTIVTFLGDWMAPFGISVVIDMAAALLLLTTSIIAFLIVVYSFQSIGIEREKYFYYPMVLFMIAGVNGAFSTGDIFNMFVFFEVFLLASYVLITMGGTRVQLQEGFKYLLVNLISSNFFVLGLAYLYSVTGSLNMADIYLKLEDYDGNMVIMTVLAVVFLFVFATKAGLFPLFFWLPGSYYAPPMPIIALFGALLTKVGVYAIARTYSLFFIENQAFTHQALLLMALLTIIMGSIGALAYTDMKKIIIYNILIAVGVIIVGFSMMDEIGTIGAMYYLIHDMIIKAALFMLVGFIIYRTGKADSEHLGGLIRKHPVTGWMFLVAGFALAGVPPLSGFYGKFFIVQSTFDNDHYVAGIIVLVSSLAVLISVVRIFMNVFWRGEMDFSTLKPIKTDKLLFASIGLVIVSVAFGLAADLLYPFFEMAASSFHDPASYASYLTEVE
ncbi:monovalent cation/H+ antiporter subunit D [Salinicoccus sediminis]|uniref:Monovalent cation/H+ antiporter subunit D n=1 Tax=Salinicoccus sediminis TaxID=1432562 RepID=A0A0M2SIG0_9STAP|nr:Na+/H+ antiporter subunit D [Salinicoccus sediminis]KKK34078.1 monovalent cation/H+ antiporter subunit D [Salinicoccus sediminis]